MISDNKYHYLTFLSWICSFIVVLYHYVSFFQIYEYQDNLYLNYLIINQKYGANFVWLYWAISGFIFTQTCLDLKNYEFKKFFFTLFKRFYPLHILTLLSICILQYTSYLLFGHTQLDFMNDFYHLLLHIFFASDWGLHQSFSFNAPVWFLSILIPVYFFAFFTIKFLKKMGIAFPIFLIILVYIINNDYQYRTILNEMQKLALFNFMQCFIYFYLGSSIYFTFKKIISLNFNHSEHFITFLTLIGVFLSIYLLNFNNHKILNAFPATILLFTSLIVLFANLDYLSKFSFKKIDVLSNTSISIYLWHLPIQILILILIRYYELDASILKSLNFFYFYITVLLTISYLSYSYYEKPLSDKISFFLRNKTN